jgi:hypothetical protein
MSFPVTVQGKTSDIFKDLGTDKKHMLGTRMTLPDGRVYRYAKAGAALTIGRAIGAAAHITTLDSDVVVMEARTTAQWDDGDHTIRIATTGSTSSTALNIVADQFNDGYIWVNDEAGEGQIFQVKDHGGETATGSTGGLDIEVYDEDILSIALTTATQVGLLKNLYHNVVVHTGTTGGGPVVGVAPVAVDSGDYCWLQTWGPCPVMAGATAPLAGEMVGVINTTGSDTGLVGVAGSFYPADATQYNPTTASTGAACSQDWNLAPKLGYTLQVPTGDAEYALIFLTIAP